MKMLKKCTISNKKKIVLGIILCAAGALFYFLAKANAWVAEYIFARVIYRGLSTIINFVTGIFPFSVIEVIVLMLPVLLLVRVIVGVVKFIKAIKRSDKGVPKKYFKKMLCNVIGAVSLTAGILMLLYVIFCGTNYHRYSFGEINNIEIKEHSDEQLYEMCKDLALRMNETRETLGREYSGADYEMTDYEMANAVKVEFDRTGDSYPCLDRNVAKSKPLFISYVFSCFETTGIYSPFTVEANVNVDIPDYQIPYTMAHEMAHVCGFMREDEANFIAYLVCSTADDPRIKYSGLSLAFSHSMNRLYDANPEYYYQVWRTLSDEVITDREVSYEYWKAFEDTKIAEVGNEINDTYLKVNNQEDGIKSYGRMVDLLLSTYYQ